MYTDCNINLIKTFLIIKYFHTAIKFINNINIQDTYFMFLPGPHLEEALATTASGGSIWQRQHFEVTN